jgi:hypothetical protein
MSLGEVDTLNLLAEKLDNLFNETQGYYESFLETNTIYKNGKMSDKEFFQKMGDYMVAYSALEFLSIKVIMEIKKTLDKMSGGQATGNTQSPGLMPGMGTPGMTMPGMGSAAPPPRVGTAQNPAGGGTPPGIVSANDAFGQVGTLPSPDPALMSKTSNESGNSCTACGNKISRPDAKFCTACGNKI